MSAVIGVFFIVVMVALAATAVIGSLLVIKKGIEIVVSWLKRIPA